MTYLSCGELAVVTIAGVAKCFHDCSRNLNSLFGGAKGHPLGHCGERLLVRRRDSLAAADVNVVALNLAAIVDCNEAQVVGQHVDAVVFRQADPNFEFTRQIVGSVNRFFDRLKVRDVFLMAGFLVTEPKVKVGVRSRAQVLRDLIGQRLHFTVNGLAVERSWAAHHVAIHIAAGGQRGEFDPIDFADRLAEVSFQDAVKLETLPSRNPQCAVAEAIAQIEFGQELRGRHFSPGNARTNHHAVGLRFAGAAAIAIFLLIGSVVFQELLHPFAERRFGRKEFLGDGPAQLAATCLEMFDLAKLRHVRHEFLTLDRGVSAPL